MFAYFAEYPTFLVFVAVVMSVVLTMVFMPAFIRFLQNRQIGQQVRDDGPQTHLVKQGTPTMGGVVMLLGVVVTVFLVGLPDPETYLLLGAVVLTGVLGLIDDMSKVAHERSLGLTPKAKLIGQFLIAGAFILCAVNVLGVAPTVDIPFIYTFDLGVLTTTIPIGEDGIQIPWLYLIFCLILLVGLCNAVNLTDGLDGLASGTVMIVMVVMAAIAFRENLLEPAIFSASLAGACVGFLWYNSYPADIFMGDTGSLFLGGAVCGLAFAADMPLILIPVGIVYIAETLSDIIQVAYFKLTHGKRIFKMAPLHHHFEMCGWKEKKVVAVFTLISALFCVAAYFGVVERYLV